MYDMNVRNRQLPRIITELNHQCKESIICLRLYGRCNLCIHQQFHSLYVYGDQKTKQKKTPGTTVTVTTTTTTTTTTDKQPG